MKIVVDDKIPFLHGTLEPYAEVVYLPGKQISNESLKDADALLIRTRTKCTENLLKGTNVRFIGSATIGFDHIDVEYCDRSGIRWTNAPGCNSSSVQQYIAAAILKIASDNNFILKGKSIGIVGVGNVGKKVEKIASTFEMNVLLNDPPRARREGDNNFVMLDTVLKESDIVTLHVPLNIAGEDNTHHLFDDDSFNKMKKGAWFFNTSRGEVTDSDSLKKALGSGRLGGAVVDVWEHEPDIDLELMAKTYIATPHIAGYSSDGKANGTSLVVNSLCEFFNLPLLNWYPGNIPQPSATEMTIFGNGKSDDIVIMEAVSHTYNITEDDKKFRFSPSDFEKQRGEYPLRREFPSYSVNLKNCSNKSGEILKALGFNVTV